jgi:hypothetical protein
MFMAWKSKEWPGDLARKCIVPGTFFTNTNPAQRCESSNTMHLRSVLSKRQHSQAYKIFK